jgi:hypothetical protein
MAGQPNYELGSQGRRLKVNHDTTIRSQVFGRSRAASEQLARDEAVLPGSARP